MEQKFTCEEIYRKRGRFTSPCFAWEGTAPRSQSLNARFRLLAPCQDIFSHDMTKGLTKPKPFSLPTLLRMTPNVLLAEFFNHFDIDIAPRDWNHLKEREIEPILMMIDDIKKESLKNRIEKILRDISMLASKNGMAAFHEAALFLDQPNWRDGLPKQGNYPTSMHAWLHHPKLFESAMANLQFSGLSYWRRRAHLPLFLPEFTEEKKQSLKKALEGFFEKHQGRGHVCTVDHYDRGNGICYITAHPNDYVEEILVHDEQENLDSRVLCKTFDVILAYDSRRGCCDLCAKVPPSLKAELEQLFLEEILGESLPSYELPPFDLSPLLQPDFSLTSASEFRISASITALSLKWEHGEMVHKTTITKSPYHDVREAFNQEKYPIYKAQVEHVKFRMFFHGIDGGKDKSITFEIREPFKCSLRNQPQEYVDTIHKLLKTWGIEHATQGTLLNAGLPMGTQETHHDEL